MIARRDPVFAESFFASFAYFAIFIKHSMRRGSAILNWARDPKLTLQIRKLLE